MDKLLEILINKDSWLALWLAVVLWEKWQLKKQADSQHKTLVVIAKNSTTAMMAFLEMMRTKKEREWGDRTSEMFRAEQLRAARKLEEQDRELDLREEDTP